MAENQQPQAPIATGKASISSKSTPPPALNSRQSNSDRQHTNTKAEDYYWRSSNLEIKEPFTSTTYSTQYLTAEYNSTVSVTSHY